MNILFMIIFICPITFEPLKMAKQKHNNKTKGGKKRNTVNKTNFVIETTNQKKKIVGITTHTLSYPSVSDSVEISAQCISHNTFT